MQLPAKAASGLPADSTVDIIGQRSFLAAPLAAGEAVLDSDGAGGERKWLPDPVRHGLLPPPDAAIGCLSSHPAASESLEGGAVCSADINDADDASHPPRYASCQPAVEVAKPLSVCCRQAQGLPLSSNDHCCGGTSPTSGRAPLQVCFALSFQLCTGLCMRLLAQSEATNTAGNSDCWSICFVCKSTPVGFDVCLAGGASHPRCDSGFVSQLCS